MDFKKLSGIITLIGALGVVVSVGWWYTFYSDVVAKTRGSMSDMVSCLHSTEAIQCKVVGLGAQFSGSTPYNPTVFWVTIVILAVGVVLKFAVKK